ncbi:MAG: transglycosylase SLT domain-containing protein [Pseudobdellovibrio sp.]|nr:transglycosylase SLT domain-containing protein [Pseudobdellovibrio sp.]
MKIKSLAFTLVLFFSTLVIFITNGCHGVYLDESKAASGVAQTTVHVGLHRDRVGKSLDEALVKSFIKDYGLKAEIHNYSSFEELNSDFENNKIEMAITRTSSRHTRSFSLQSPAYDDLQISLFCKNSENISQVFIPAKLAFIQKEFLMAAPDLQDRITVVDGSFESIAEKSYQIKHSCFMAESKFSKTSQVENKKYAKAWASENIYPLAWLINKDANDLNKLVQIWFQKLIRENRMVRFKDQYDAPFFKMSLLEYKHFKNDVKTKLPQWKKVFVKYSEKYQVPWLLIAAVAYQESRWESEATSYTGVKGFMQLTSATAQHLGIADREDPIQSIQGGSYYLQYLYDKMPTKITHFERWIQALASYNIGYAHLRDIHRLAQARSLDPYRWKNLKVLLPEKENDENLDIFIYGLARGEETVDFIDNVLMYHEALTHLFTQPLPTSRDF